MNVRGFAALARMHRFRMDQHRRRAMEVEIERANLMQQDAALLQELEAERASVSYVDLTMTNFAAFLKHIETRREHLANAIARHDSALARISEQMAVEYREAKKFELALEQEAQRQKKLADKTEQDQLDEIGLTYRRQAAR